MCRDLRYSRGSSRSPYCTVIRVLIVVYFGDAQPHLCAFARGTRQREPPSKLLGALAHPDQSVVAPIRRVDYGQIEAAPVVFDFHLQAATVGSKRDRNM